MLVMGWADTGPGYCQFGASGFAMELGGQCCVVVFYFFGRLVSEACGTGLLLDGFGY